jgi:hypothetical protein
MMSFVTLKLGLACDISRGFLSSIGSTASVDSQAAMGNDRRIARVKFEERGVTKVELRHGDRRRPPAAHGRHS